MKTILKIFSKDDCSWCSTDIVSSLIRSILPKASELGIEIESYNINTSDGLAEAALERIAIASMPIFMIREE